MSFNLRNKKFYSKFTLFMSQYRTSTACAAIVILILLSSLLPAVIPFNAFAAKPFVLRTSQQVYVPGETLVVYGAATPDETLVIRIYDPSGLAIRITNVKVDEKGFFKEGIFEWPDPSKNLAFGSYTVEAFSSVGGKEPQRVEVSFAEGTQEGVQPQFPKTHILAVKLDAPDQVRAGGQFRIFVQVTFDGALVDANLDPKVISEILGSSHIHSSNDTIILDKKFKELHPGLYYADVALEKEDTYIIHAVAFYRGFLSHDSHVVAVTSSSIGSIQESVNQLDAELDATNQELQHLRDRLDETRSALNDTKSAITNSVENAQGSINEEIGNIQQASGQINSIILPVLALISVIIALQISLFARIRASYK
jgi:hypothetical protein